MKIKRILLVSVSIVGLLAIALGAAVSFMASTTSAKADEAPFNQPAALSVEQTTIDYAAQNEVSSGGMKDSDSFSKDLSSGGHHCEREQAIDWAAED